MYVKKIAVEKIKVGKWYSQKSKMLDALSEAVFRKTFKIYMSWTTSF